MCPRGEPRESIRWRPYDAIETAALQAMNLFRIAWAKLCAVFRKEQLDTEMAQELRSHIEMQTQENIESGMKPEEARYAAIRQFGWVDSIKETCREQRGVAWIETFIQDIRLGL